MSWILAQIKDTLKWEGASEKELERLLQTGTHYPYWRFGEPKGFRELFNYWVEYVKSYQERANGDIKLALQLADQDAEARYQEGLKWVQEHPEEIKAIFDKYK